jgi:hypothetical protein
MGRRTRRPGFIRSTILRRSEFVFLRLIVNITGTGADGSADRRTAGDAATGQRSSRGADARPDRAARKRPLFGFVEAGAGGQADHGRENQWDRNALHGILRSLWALGKSHPSYQSWPRFGPEPFKKRNALEVARIRMSARSVAKMSLPFEHRSRLGAKPWLGFRSAPCQLPERREHDT